MRFFNIPGAGKREERSKRKGSIKQQGTGAQTMTVEAEAFHYPKYNLAVVMLGRMVTLQVEKKAMF